MKEKPYEMYQQYFLSTEGYFFIYRPDKHDSLVIRATLYKSGTNEVIDDVRVSEGYGRPAKNIHDIINYFEARLQMGLIGHIPKPTYTDYLIECENPEAFDRTINSMGAVLFDGGIKGNYQKQDGYYVMRVFGSPGFVEFAIRNQGYGKIIKQLSP